jgi:hypothetical protein
MPRATCRCGQTLTAPDGASERVVCPKCGARVRIRQKNASSSDGYIRFFCPCGRRLKVSAMKPPSHGKCPDCARIVPVPASPSITQAGHPDASTEELNASDVERLERWAQNHAMRNPNPGMYGVVTDIRVQPASAPSLPGREEVGIRICPTCGKPLHLSATVCRDCGTPAPKR